MQSRAAMSYLIYDNPLVSPFNSMDRDEKLNI